MTDEEWGIWHVITAGLGANDPVPTREVLDWAIAIGRDTGVARDRVEEIFRAINSGTRPGTPPL